MLEVMVMDVLSSQNGIAKSDWRFLL